MYRYSVALVFESLTLILGLQVSDGVVRFEHLAGKLSFYQREGDATYVRDSGELASEVPTEAFFELFDPQNTLRAAHFSYTWDLGDGNVIEGSEPFVRYNYSVSGNYTISLHVGANVTRRAKPLTAVYSMDVKVLDAIKHIEMKGPTSYQVSENASLSLRVDGSPPMWVCWRVLPHCASDLQVGCRLAMLYGHTLTLNHTFTSTGVHCLDVSARNDISKLQTSYSIYVQRDPHSNLFFIIPSAAVLIATFSFIIVFACRPRSAKPKVATSSNATYTNMEMCIPGNDPSPSDVVVSGRSARQREDQPLLP